MIAFLFAGQGAQKPSMGEDLYQNNNTFKSIFDKYPSIRDIILSGDADVLNQTKNTQKAILLTSYAIAKCLEEKGIIPDYVAGLSLGEYSALTFSDTWELTDAVEIVTKRGQIMQDALPLGTTGMRAILGLDENTIREAIKDINGVCEIANLNCPGQIVITGDNNALEEATTILKEKGALRIIPLNVSGAFHSSLLTNSSLELKEVLDMYNHQTPKYKALFNYTGDESTDSLNEILKNQICHSVYFEKIIKKMIEKGVDTFVEIGPGKTLAGFVKKISKEVKVYSVNDEASMAEVIGGIL